MSAEENAALVRREWDFIHAHDLTGFGAFFAENCAVGFRFHGHAPRGVENLLAAPLTAFPDYHYTVEDLLAVEDKVICRWSWRGTHRGALMGIAPSGKQMTTCGIGIYHIVDGKYAEIWEEWDMAGFLEQLGALPA